MSKRIILLVLCVGIVSVIVSCGKQKPTNDIVSPTPTPMTQAGSTGTTGANGTNKDNSSSTSGQSQNGTATTPQPKVKPTFMYFVAKSDGKYDEAMAVYKELEKEYGDRVKFDVQDVDANPELKDRYMINQPDSPMPMKTPTLIMLDTNNDISTMGLSECTDKGQLKDAIEKALSK